VIDDFVLGETIYWLAVQHTTYFEPAAEGK
jgi:hypothetical protein